MCQTRSVLRRLLRLVDRHVTSHNGNGLWRNYLLKEFRRKTDGQSQQEIQHWITCAGQYAELIHSVQSHKVLMTRTWAAVVASPFSVAELVGIV